MNYYIEDFTEANYRKILEAMIGKGYTFTAFDYETINSDEKIVIWRHDVDFSLNRARRLAEIESKIEKTKIKSTYFIHLQSSFYNVLESDQYKMIGEIVDLGHEIGLHFDHGFYTQDKRMTDEKEIEEYAFLEKEMLEKYFGIDIEAVSFHNPEAANTLTLRQDYYAGMVNAYSQTIFDNCKYCSDSNGYWRYDRLEDVIETGHAKLHILTHPAWWTPSAMMPYERIKRCVDGRREMVMEAYHDMLERCGRVNAGYTGR